MIGLPWDVKVGLYQNIPRVRAQRQADVAAGVSAAMASDPADVPSLEWFEAQTDDPQEAKLWWLQALQRAQAAKAHRG